ncbi:MAG TPA: hypothetical protein VHZ97_14070 [Pseudonocardiaceae bacterium]|nr:hypothetical protein [Pseudonocardiaceae bacterium]
MSGRILRIELRRSSAWVTGLVIALLGIAGLLSLALSTEGYVWDGQWATLATFQRIMLVLLWPLTVGAGAWQARRDRRSRAEELLGTTARPSWRRMLPAAMAMALCLIVGYVLIFAVGAIKVAGDTDCFSTNWLPVALVGALSLVAAGWLGMGIGRLVPSVYTPPVLVVLGFLVLLLPIQLSKGDAPGSSALFSPGFTDTADEFSRVAPSVDVGQLVWFAGLALGGLLLVMFARRIASMAALVPAVLALVIVVPIFAAAPAGGMQADPGALVAVCTHDGGPAVCVTAAHAKALDSLVGPAREALTQLAKLPDPPTSVHEVLSQQAGPQPADQVWFDSDNYAPGQGWDTTVNAQLVVKVLAGAGTRPCGSIDYAVRAIAAAWLVGQYPAPGLDSGGGDWLAKNNAMWQALTELPHDQQVQRIAAVRQAGLTCGNVSAALTGGH